MGDGSPDRKPHFCQEGVEGRVDFDFQETWIWASKENKKTLQAGQLATRPRPSEVMLGRSVSEAPPC